MPNEVKQDSRFVPLDARCDGCHGQATMIIDEDGRPRCAVCRLHDLSAEEGAIVASIDAVRRAILATIEEESVHPDDLRNLIVALLDSDEVAVRADAAAST